MKTLTISLIRNQKLQTLAVEMDIKKVEQAMQISSKIKPKSLADEYATSALICEMRGESEKAIDCEKKAICAKIFENYQGKRQSIHNKFDNEEIESWTNAYMKRSVRFGICNDATIETMKSQLETIFGKGAFDSDILFFCQRRLAM